MQILVIHIFIPATAVEMPAASSAALALAVSGGASALAPPPLSCEQLAYFVKIACCPSEHERAVKQQLYITTLGLALLLGLSRCR